MMTYADLAELISRMTPTELNQNVSIYVNDTDEFYPVEQVLRSDETNDVLDVDHWFLVV